jgi:hypothetical protein
MRVIGRLLIALAVAFPLIVALASVADGATGGSAVLDCGFWKDGMRISPGVGNAPANQTVSAHGRLYGCNKAGEGGQFSATLQMSQATCADLSMSGTASFDWVSGAHSTAFLDFSSQATEPSKVHVTGSMTSGLFQGLVVNAWLRFTPVFSGTGPNCSPTNLLKVIDFTNTRSFQLLTPIVTTTTQPPNTVPTTRPHNTTPRTPPTTVPITNFGGPPTAPPTAAPVTVVVQGGPPNNGGGGFVSQQFPQGTLAFTGSSSGIAAMFGFEALLVGGALACADPGRRRRRLQRFAYVHRPKSFLHVTLPPMH